MTTTPQQIVSALASEGIPAPSTGFLTTLLANSRSPLPALLKTAKLRLLAADFTASPPVLHPSALPFPTDTTNPEVQEKKLAGPIPVQVVGVEDLSKSRWEQLEAIEAQEKGETTRGREIIRVVPVAQDGEDGGGGGSSAGNTSASRQTTGLVGPHRLVLQDVKGQKVYGLELRPIAGVGVGMQIGTKIILSGVTIARGVVLMEPATVTVLGGKIDALHKDWQENRKKRLQAAIEGLSEGG